MADHRYLTTAQVHEPKHISTSTGSDAGKVITPTAAGSASELRFLSLSDLSDGGDAATLTSILEDDTINFQGWEMVEDGLVTTPTITVTDTATKITIDDEGVVNKTNEDYLPRIIRGTDNLWNRTTSRLDPIAEGDCYDIRLNVTVTGTTGTPEVLTCQLDIGSTSAPTDVVAESSVYVGRTEPYVISFSFPIFCLSTFVANGGQFFLSTKTGTITVADRSLLIIRTGSGSNA